MAQICEVLLSYYNSNIYPITAKTIPTAPIEKTLKMWIFVISERPLKVFDFRAKRRKTHMYLSLNNATTTFMGSWVKVEMPTSNPVIFIS